MGLGTSEAGPELGDGVGRGGGSCCQKVFRLSAHTSYEQHFVSTFKEISGGNVELRVKISNTKDRE